MAALVQIQVSDPWDLGEAIRWRPLQGVAKRESPLTIELDTPLQVGDRQICWLVGNPRQADQAVSATPHPYNLIGVDQLDADPEIMISRWRGPANGAAMIATVRLQG